jgi:hypothetical protein
MQGGPVPREQRNLAPHLALGTLAVDVVSRNMLNPENVRVYPFAPKRVFSAQNVLSVWVTCLAAAQFDAGFPPQVAANVPYEYIFSNKKM